LEIANLYNTVADSALSHIRGQGEGSLQVSIVDPTATTGHLYQITFDDASSNKTTYDVFDKDTRHFVLKNADQMTPDLAGPLFDGLRLVIDDIKKITINPDRTHWIGDSVNISFDISLYSEENNLPVDYQIRFFNHVVDTSSNNIPIKFRVWNVTDSLSFEVYFMDSDLDGEVSVNDKIYPFYYKGSQLIQTMVSAIHDPDNGTATVPQGGEIYSIATIKPFSYRDVYEFKAPTALDGIRFKPHKPAYFYISQNFPNPFNQSTAFRYHLGQAALVRMIIYDINGRTVKRLVNRRVSAGDHLIIWDGRNALKRTVASGLYFYEISAGGKTVIKKCLLLK